MSSQKKPIFLACLLLLLSLSSLQAQSTNYDSLLNNSQWYVPLPYMLAYMTPTNTFGIQIPVGDQTLWNIPSATNGVFSGTTSATLIVGTNAMGSTFTMQGVVTDSGQVRMVFTPTGGGIATIGVGQVRTSGTNTYIQMQMINANGGSTYVSHWADMALYNTNTTIPPSPQIPANTNALSQGWQWVLGKSWNFNSLPLAGTNESGSFYIYGYQNGYFFGTGTGSTNTQTNTFTLLGSVTPEGNLIFNTISGDSYDLTSMSGYLSGTNTNSDMFLRSYDTNGNIGSPVEATMVQDLTISSSTVLADGNIHSYNNTSIGSNSTLLIANDTILTNSSNLYVGENGPGTLIIANGSTAAAQQIFIEQQGIVKGSGLLNGAVNNSGVLNPTGLMTINGDFTQTATGALEIEVAGPTQYGSLQVNGAVNLGGTLHISPNGAPLTYGEKLTLITATGSIGGTFDSMVVDQPNCRARLEITGDPVAAVFIAPSSYTLVAQNANELNVAAALDSFIPATSGDEQVVSTALDQLTASEYPSAFNQIMPTLYESLSTIAFNIANAQNQELIQRLWGLRVAGDGGARFSMHGFGENTPLLQGQGDKKIQESKEDILRPSADNHWGMFLDGNGIFAQATSANMLPTYNTESGGVTTGLAYNWNEHLATGLYSGYEGDYSKYNGGSSLINNSVRFGCFGTYGEGHGKGFFVDALAGGDYGSYTMQRNIAFGPLDCTATGTPSAGELDAMLASGYDFKKGNWTFGPMSSLQYLYFNEAAFSETGAQSLNLNAQGWNSSSMIYSLGSHVAYSWQASKGILVVPQISLNWQHEFLQNPYAINSTLGGVSPLFATWSSSPLRDTLYTGIGVTIAFANNWDCSFFYNAAAGNQDLMSQNLFWSVGVRF